MLQHEPEPAGARLQRLAAHYAVAFSMTQQEFVKATVLAREQLIAMADALDLRVDKGSPAARLLAPPAALDAPPVWADPATGHELHYDALQTLPLTRAQSTDAAPAASQAAEVLAAGIQEVSNAMVEDFRLNDIVRMVLETMLRALGARRIVFCLRGRKPSRRVDDELRLTQVALGTSNVHGVSRWSSSSVRFSDSTIGSAARSETSWNRPSSRVGTTVCRVLWNTRSSTIGAGSVGEVPGRPASSRTARLA